MKYLLDVSILVAWGWLDHAAHEPTAKWIAEVRARKRARLLTSAIPELGFVRVSVRRTGGQVTVQAAARTLSAMLGTLGASHGFLPDDRRASDFPGWCRGAARTTDAHLLGLAEAHGARLATLDKGIPGALVVPGAADAG